MSSGPVKPPVSHSSPAVAQMLRGAGLRCTPVRLAVIQLLLQQPRPMGVAQIVEQLPARSGMVTVYRTLNTLTTKLLLHRVRGEDGAWLYAIESTSPREPSKAHSHGHAHFVCDGCGTVECLKDALVPANVIQGVQMGRGYDVAYSELLLHGTCPKCHK